MMSVTCKTAIKALIYLATRQGSEVKSSLREIAGYIHASEHTVGKLLQALVKKKLINSTKGPSGGFYMTRTQCLQPLIRIVEAIDGEDVFTECGLGLKKCSSKHPCPIHNEYKVVRETFEQICREKKLIDLCGPVHEGLTHLTI